MTGPGPGNPGRSGWWLAVPIVAIACCAGPALLAAAGAGSLGVLVGGATGLAAIAGSALSLLLLVAWVVFVRRRKVDR